LILEAVGSSGGGQAARLKVPSGFKAEDARAFERLENYSVSCYWCGQRYEKYSLTLEDEHFAHDCPNAPKELQQDARSRLRAIASKAEAVLRKPK
jgi:hypothetical protein